MFTEKEIKLMRSIGLDCDFQNLSEDDDYWAEIEDKVADKLVIDGLEVINEGLENEDYYSNEIGIICDSIIDKIPH